MVALQMFEIQRACENGILFFKEAGWAHLKCK